MVIINNGCRRPNTLPLLLLLQAKHEEIKPTVNLACKKILATLIAQRKKDKKNSRFRVDHDGRAI